MVIFHSCFLEEESKSKGGFKELFDLGNVKKGYIALFKPREHNVRTYLILLMLIFEMEMFINVGEWGNAYLYLRRVLNFELEDFAR